MLSLRRLITKIIILLFGVTVKNTFYVQPTYSAETQSAPDHVLSIAQGTNREIGKYLFYNEMTYLPQISNAINECKLIYQFVDINSIKPYLGIAIGQDLQSTSDLIYNDNHVSPLAGIRYNPPSFPFGLYLEFRQNMRIIRPPSTREFSQGDLRAGGYLYQWFNLTQAQSSLRLFQETYGEAFYTSVLLSNVIFQGWLKQGGRIRINTALDFDAYFELAGRLDRTNNPDFNLGYFDVGIRTNIRIENLLTQIIIKKPLYYISVPRNLNFPWSAQIVVSGEF